MDTVPRLFQIVAPRVERPPIRIARFIVERPASFATVTPFGDSKLDKVVLRVFQRDVVGTAGQTWKT